MPLPHGVSVWKAEAILGGYRRSTSAVENVDEIYLAFREHAQPRLSCAYCGSRANGRTAPGVIGWWHAHNCRPLEAAEARGLVLDSQPLC